MSLNYISKPPHKNQGLWAKLWQRRKDRRYDKKDNKRKAQLTRVLCLLGIMIGAVIYAQVTPTPSNRASTKIGDSQQFGTLGKRVILEETQFNHDNGLMLVRLKVTNGTDDATVTKINWEKVSIQFGGQGWRQDVPTTKAQIIPTSDDTVTVAFENVNPGFQVVELKISDTQLDSSKLTVNKYRKDKEDDKKEDEEEQIAVIIINRDSPESIKLTQVPTQNELATDEMTRKIKSSNALISEAQSNNEAIEKEINETRNSIKELEVDRKLMSASGQATIDTQIKDLNQSIISMNNNKQQNVDLINTERENIETYQRNIKNIYDGSVVLGKVQKF